MAQSRMSGAPSEIQTHSWRFATLPCSPLQYPRCPSAEIDLIFSISTDRSAFYKTFIWYSKVGGSSIFRWRGRAWLTKWGRVKISRYSHKLMHRKRVTCELHDSYFRSMMIKTCHSKDGGSGIFRWPFVGRDWVDVELLYNSVHRKFNESWRNDAVEKTAPSRRGSRGPRLSSLRSDELGIRRVGEKMLEWEHIPERLGPQLSSQENGKETLMAIRVGVSMLQFCSVSNILSHTTLSNEARGIFF